MRYLPVMLWVASDTPDLVSITTKPATDTAVTASGPPKLAIVRVEGDGTDEAPTT